MELGGFCSHASLENSPAKPSGPPVVFFVRRYLNTNSVPLVGTDLSRLTVLLDDFWYLCLSSSLSTLLHFLKRTVLGTP